MFNLRIAVVLGFVLAFSTVARAGTPIEFTFGGVFTRTQGTNHPLGGPFTSTVLFDPDAPDGDGSPNFGLYEYISWTAPYRFMSTPITFSNPPTTVGAIKVSLGQGGHTWRFDREGAVGFGFLLDVQFPPGTFASDALPQTLDLSLSNGTGFDANFGVDLQGMITSFSSRVIPEPSTGLVASITLLYLARCAGRRG